MRIVLTTLLLFFWGNVGAASLPEANLTITPATIEAGKEVTFDASDSRNTNGQRGGLEYRFQFDNSGSWTSWGAQSKAKFTPQNVGSFRGKLQVRDRQWKTVQTTYRNYRVVGEIYRKIRIRVSPSRIRAGEPMYFELIFTLPRTDDPDKLYVRWDFDSDGYFEIPWSAYRIVSHVFGETEVGTFSPTAEVLFPDGSIQKVRGIERISTRATRRPAYRDYWSKISVLPPSVVSPIVDVSPGKEGFNEDTTFRFDASSSRIADHAWLEWSFDGEDFIKDDKVVYKKFDSPGKHEVRVRTCYDHSAPKCRETLVTVNVRYDPIDFRTEITAQNLTRNTSFRTDTSSSYFAVVVGDRMRFSANLKRRDVVEKEFTYRWDFEGDGVWDTNFLTSPVAEFTYPRAGNFKPTIDTENEKGLHTITSLPLRVYSNTAPKANFTVDQAQIYPGELVRLYPKINDLQNDTSRLEVRFDADGDGNWDHRFRRATTHQWRYDQSGKYVARMQVRDQNMDVSTVERVVTVLPYTKPEAKVTISQRSGDTRTSFWFDASRSTGQNLKYYWDFDYKGPQDVINQGKKLTAGGVKVQKRFSDSGEKTILLRVVDKAGNTDDIHFSVFVSQYIPVATFPKKNTTQTSSALPKTQEKNITPPQTSLTIPALTRAELYSLLYQAAKTPPPIPVENPFSDVRAEDWFYDVAIQSYLDGYTHEPKFFPYESVSSGEAQTIGRSILGKQIQLGDRATKQSLVEALRQ